MEESDDWTKRHLAIDRFQSIVSGLPWFLTYTLDFYIIRIP